MWLHNWSILLQMCLIQPLPSCFAMRQVWARATEAATLYLNQHNQKRPMSVWEAGMTCKTWWSHLFYRKSYKCRFSWSMSFKVISLVAFCILVGIPDFDQFVDAPKLNVLDICKVTILIFVIICQDTVHRIWSKQSQRVREQKRI